MKPALVIISLSFLFIVAIIGSILRFFPFIPVSFEYTNLLHAHSHVAFQGWIYLTLVQLLTTSFLSQDQIHSKKINLQYGLTTIVLICILISFVFQGYGLYSILFSTLFQILNYWFAFSFLSSLKTQEKVQFRFIRTGIWLGLLSTIIPFVVGVLSANDLNGTEIYRSFIYAFMHLQYNGWYLFIILGLFFHSLDGHKVPWHAKSATLFYRLLTFAVLPSISLSLLGMSYSKYIIAIAYISVVLLILALFFFIKSLPAQFVVYFKKNNKWFRVFIFLALIFLIIKIILQCLSVIPTFNSLAFFNKPIIIGYLHMSLIGSISFMLFAFIIERNWVQLNYLFGLGSTFLISGFILTESYLVLNGLGYTAMYEFLLLGSVAMALGILLIIISTIKKLFHE